MSLESFNTQSGQTLYDIALTTYGTMEGVVDLLVLNALDFDSVLPASLTYYIQDNYIVKHLGKTQIATDSDLVVTMPVTLLYINSGNGDDEIPTLTPSTVKIHRVKAEQNIFDIACMITGRMEDVIDVILQNSLTFDTHLTVGSTIKYTGDLYISDDITTGGTQQAQKVAGAFSDGFHDGFQ